jgi:hypothetical protein
MSTQKRHWKAKPEAGPVAGAVEAVWAFIGGKDESPQRPWTFKIVGEDGVERELFAPPPGRIERWTR